MGMAKLSLIRQSPPHTSLNICEAPVVGAARCLVVGSLMVLGCMLRMLLIKMEAKSLPLASIHCFIFTA